MEFEFYASHAIMNKLQLINGLNKMNLFDRIIHWFQNAYVPYEENEMETVKASPRKSFEPSVNPATGMPMVGSVDCMGDPFGQRSRHEHIRSSYDDYYRHQSSYDSSNRFDNRWNDPFNRY